MLGFTFIAELQKIELVTFYCSILLLGVAVSHTSFDLCPRCGADPGIVQTKIHLNHYLKTQLLLFLPIGHAVNS